MNVADVIAIVMQRYDALAVLNCWWVMAGRFAQPAVAERLHRIRRLNGHYPAPPSGYTVITAYHQPITRRD